MLYSLNQYYTEKLAKLGILGEELILSDKSSHDILQAGFRRMAVIRK